METTEKIAIVSGSDHPSRIETARHAAISRTPEPARRVTKKKIDAVTWLCCPKRCPRNS